MQDIRGKQLINCKIRANDKKTGTQPLFIYYNHGIYISPHKWDNFLYITLGSHIYGCNRNINIINMKEERNRRNSCKLFNIGGTKFNK